MSGTSPDDVIREFGSRRDACLCAPEDKARLETENSLYQFEYLQQAIKLRSSKRILESDVIELQRIAIEGIYPCGGGYRQSSFTMEITGSGHEPPGASTVRGHVVDMVEWCNDRTRPALVRAAYALWRFNWIHPFPGGNGRSARALSYLVLAFDLGLFPSGESSLMERIKESKAGYLAALPAVDKLYKARSSEEDLATGLPPGLPRYLVPMVQFLEPLVIAQLRSTVDKYGAQ